MPKRIQRQRTKGWKMPPNARCVTRPSKWGNPYEVSVYGVDLALALFRDTVRGCWNPALVDRLSDQEVSATYKRHRDWLTRHRHQVWAAMHIEIRGKDLACWCPLGSPCHADILLELANA